MACSKVASTQRYGLIILGNSGVGKSFLANLFLQNEQFVHKATPTAVTTATEYVKYKVDNTTYVVFNIPGLVEAKQEQIDLNKKEIDKAFKKCPNAVVIYVFGTQHGRLRNEDVVAYDALNDAYPFDPKSLVLVVNGIPNDRETTYEGETIVLLRDLLKLKAEYKNFCFLNWVNKQDNQEKIDLRDQLLQAVLNAKPKIHQKQHDIHLQMDEIKGLKNHITEMRDEFNKQRQQLEAEFHATQKTHQQEMKEQYEEYQRQLKLQQKSAELLEQKVNQYQKTNDDLQKKFKEQQRSPDTNPLSGLLRIVGKTLITGADVIKEATKLPSTIRRNIIIE